MTFPDSATRMDGATWIDGLPEESAVVPGATLHDPNTGAVIAPMRSSSPAQVDRAVAAATAAHARGDWVAAGVGGRARLLLDWADALDKTAGEIARLDALQSGVPLAGWPGTCSARTSTRRSRSVPVSPRAR